MQIMRPLILALFAGAAAPAFAQEYTAPRYEALEQQLQTLNQHELDNVENQRITNQQQSLANGRMTAAQRALDDLEFQRKEQALILKNEQDRERAERERAIADAALPNRSISPLSPMVVTNPEAYGLPKLPANKYYARVDGRFVTVDRMSTLVEQVLPVQPTDPTADRPSGPPALLPPIPLYREAGAGLPPAPPGQYYSTQDGHFVLVDAGTGHVVGTTSVSTTRP